jgi:hypothetical protein
MGADEFNELFNERAAIREFEGGFGRDDAEFKALLDLKRMVGRDAIPVEIWNRVKNTEMNSNGR